MTSRAHARTRHAARRRWKLALAIIAVAWTFAATYGLTRLWIDDHRPPAHLGPATSQTVTDWPQPGQGRP